MCKYSHDVSKLLLLLLFPPLPPLLTTYNRGGYSIGPYGSYLERYTHIPCQGGWRLRRSLMSAKMMCVLVCSSLTRLFCRGVADKLMCLHALSA